MHITTAYHVSCPNGQTHGVMMSLLRQGDVTTSFRRYNDFIIATCARWG